MDGNIVDVDIFETCWETRNLKKTLLKKGNIETITDDIGIKKRGKLRFRFGLKVC
ncbi:MAG: hypothetical protein WA130_19575 [Candidatus Methanoperedens sp.]